MMSSSVYKRNPSDTKIDEIIKLQLRKPKNWNWSLSTSKSSPHIAIPTIQLFNSKGILLIEAKDNGKTCNVWNSEDWNSNNSEKIEINDGKRQFQSNISQTADKKTTECSNHPRRSLSNSFQDKYRKRSIPSKYCNDGDKRSLKQLSKETGYPCLSRSRSDVLQKYFNRNESVKIEKRPNFMYYEKGNIEDIKRKITQNAEKVNSIKKSKSEILSKSSLGVSKVKNKFDHRATVPNFSQWREKRFQSNDPFQRKMKYNEESAKRALEDGYTKFITPHLFKSKSVNNVVRSNNSSPPKTEPRVNESSSETDKWTTRTSLAGTLIVPEEEQTAEGPVRRRRKNRSDSTKQTNQTRGKNEINNEKDLFQPQDDKNRKDEPRKRSKNYQRYRSDPGEIHRYKKYTEDSSEDNDEHLMQIIQRRILRESLLDDISNLKQQMTKDAHINRERKNKKKIYQRHISDSIIAVKPHRLQCQSISKNEFRLDKIEQMSFDIEEKSSDQQNDVSPVQILEDNRNESSVDFDKSVKNVIEIDQKLSNEGINDEEMHKRNSEYLDDKIKEKHDFEDNVENDQQKNLDVKSIDTNQNEIDAEQSDYTEVEVSSKSESGNGMKMNKKETEEIQSESSSEEYTEEIIEYEIEVEDTDEENNLSKIEKNVNSKEILENLDTAKRNLSDNVDDKFKSDSDFKRNSSSDKHDKKLENDLWEKENKRKTSDLIEIHSELDSDKEIVKTSSDNDSDKDASVDREKSIHWANQSGQRSFIEKNDVNSNYIVQQWSPNRDFVDNESSDRSTAKRHKLERKIKRAMGLRHNGNKEIRNKLTKKKDCFFKVNDITEEIVFKLNDEELKDLIPSIGKRHLFKEKMKEIKNQNFISELANDIFSSNNCETENNVNDPNIIKSVISPTVSDISECSAHSNLSEISSNTTEYFVIPAMNRDVAFYGSQDMFKAIEFPDFDLKTLLDTSPMGKAILRNYEKNGILDNTNRSRMVDIIVKHIYTFIVKHRLKHDNYNMIVAKIIALFPNECAQTYYVPAIKKRDSQTGRPILAKGRLVDKIRNLLFKSGDTVPQKRRCLTIIDENQILQADVTIVSENTLRNISADTTPTRNNYRHFGSDQVSEFSATTEDSECSESSQTTNKSLGCENPSREAKEKNRERKDQVELCLHHENSKAEGQSHMGANVSRHSAKGLHGRRTQSSGNICGSGGKGRLASDDSGSAKGVCGSLPSYLEENQESTTQNSSTYNNNHQRKDSYGKTNNAQVLPLGEGVPLHWKFSDTQTNFCDQGYGSERSPEEEQPPSLLLNQNLKEYNHCHRHLDPVSCYPFITPECTFEVSLVKGSRGLGLSVTGGTDCGGSWPGLIRIKRLFPSQPAAVCGQLNIGDLLLEVNGISLIGLTNYEALEVLRTAPNHVDLKVCRPPADVLNCVSPISEIPPPPPRREQPSSLGYSPPANNLLPDDEMFIGQFEITMTKIQGSLGFTLRKEDDSALGHYVRALVREPALSDGRIQPGDKIIAVNDVEISAMSHEQAVQFLRQAGDVVKLKLYRDSSQTPVSTLSPNETTPRTSFIRKAHLRQEAMDMLNDLALRKINNQDIYSLSPNSSPRRIRRHMFPSNASQISDPGDRIIHDDDQFHEAFLKKSNQIEDDPFNSLFTNSDCDRPSRPNSLDLCNSKGTPVITRKPKFNFSLAHNAYELNNLDSDILDAPNIAYSMKDDVESAEVESMDSFPQEPVSMPHIPVDNPEFSHKNPAYQSAHLPSTNDTPTGAVDSERESRKNEGNMHKWKGVVFDGDEKAKKETEIAQNNRSNNREELEQILAVELNRGWNSRLGFSLQGRAGNTYISAVHSNSVAAKDGRLKAGDKVIKVNDESVEKMNTNEIIDLLRIVRGPVCIVVSRKKSNQDCKNRSNAEN